MKNKGIALKLTVLVLASVTLVFSLIFTYNYYVSRGIIIRNIEKNAQNLARATVNRIDMVLNGIEKIPETLAYIQEGSYDTRADIINQLGRIVEKNPDIYGATIAFEPSAFGPGIRTFAPYFYKRDGKLEFTTIDYDYFYWDWYQIPKELGRSVWTEPFYDEGAGDIIMATYSVPFYKTMDGEKKFMGVVTADISIEWLQDIVDSIKIAETGYGFLVSKNGTFVTHPDSKLIMNETIFSVAEALADPGMREIGRQMIWNQTGFTPFTSIATGKPCWMVYAPLSSGWALGVLFPQEELMADITRLNRTVVVLGIAGFFIILAVIVWIAGTITRPLRALSSATEQFAVGNLDIALPPVKTADEVGKLTVSFDTMKTSLKRYIRELTETTAAKERIESELKIAHDIQMGILPKTFPPFPDRPEFGIFAALEPAREVGGDLYDFFFIDADHLCFAVGDVSGKGVPAALFMAVTKTLVKTKAVQGLTPDMVLTRVNEDLAFENFASMFVTLFLGILNVRTGEVAYCNAGHNPPYVVGGKGDPAALELTGGIILGVKPDFVYRSKNINLSKGDTLFLFTDGVTEAMNPAGELFSEKRLESCLRELKDRSVETMVAGVMDAVQVYAQGAPQADDITLLALTFQGSP